MNEAHTKWKEEWRGACETFQKLESDRIDFLRSSLWNYANLFSTACVADDEGCERIRVQLEKCDIEADLMTVAKQKGTGSDVPAPPNYGPLAISPLPAVQSYSAAPSASVSKASNQSSYGGSYSQSNVQPSGPTSPVQQQQQTQQAQSPGGPEGSGSEEEDLFEYDPYDFSVAKSVMFYVRVLYNYAPQAYEELPIQKGQFIPVIDQQDDGWWEGETLDEKGRKRRGLFPSNFVEKVAGAGGP
ncbi:hypothetical protein HDU93_007701 [Gonapodya sp. JEL0774]|nr:hypothetical protein HDU93_007701 [Gonapodya sp. JEL0774]